MFAHGFSVVLKLALSLTVNSEQRKRLFTHLCEVLYLDFLFQVSSLPPHSSLFHFSRLRHTPIRPHQRGNMATHPGFLNQSDVHQRGQCEKRGKFMPDRNTGAYSSKRNNSTATAYEQPQPWQLFFLFFLQFPDTPS